MSDFSTILKKYLVNNAYVDKKMQPLATKADLDRFADAHPLWMFPGLKITVIEDEDGQMRDYRCEIVDGEKVWVSCEGVKDDEFNEKIDELKNTDAAISNRVDEVEEILTITGSDLE